MTLQVFRNGEQVDDRVLATSLTFQNGDTVIDQPYIPDSGSWEPAAYTFQVTLDATEPSSGTESSIDTAVSDDDLVIPD